MNDELFKKAKDDFEKATIAWIDASEKTRRFVRNQPIDPIKDIVPLSLEETQEMDDAYEEEEKAHKQYMKAVEAFSQLISKKPGR